MDSGTHRADRPLPPPIVVAHGRDVLFFRSRAGVEQAVDPRDVAGGHYRAWDGSGRELRLDLGDAVCLDLAPVLVSVASGPSGRSDDLAAILRDFLSARGTPPPAPAEVSELIALAVAHAGYTT